MKIITFTITLIMFTVAVYQVIHDINPIISALCSLAMGIVTVATEE